MPKNKMGKRIGFLMPYIADPDNLRLAFWKARKGKEIKEEVIDFRKYLDKNLVSLRNELLNGTEEVGNYYYFTIHDPKERVICAAPFRQRVLHHAIMNVCHPIFERFQIFDSYATRVGKGQYAALERAKIYSAKYQWFCKLDVRKYFDSIDHEVLYQQLTTKFKDPYLLDLFHKSTKLTKQNQHMIYQKSCYTTFLAAPYHGLFMVYIQVPILLFIVM